MADCPHCHQPIEIGEVNYGTLFSCPVCNAVYFVGWDGQPELAPTAEEMAAENLEVSDHPNIATEIAFMPIETTSQETIIDNFAYQSQDYESLPEPTPGLEEDSSITPGSNEFATGDVPNVESDYDFSQPLDRMPEPSAIDSPGFQDVNDFANSDQETSPLSYSLTISGIDSGKIFGELRDALSDSRFAWDLSALMKTIRDGSLTIDGLNPAKIFVIVSRVKYLSVQLSWRQDVLATP